MAQTIGTSIFIVGVLPMTIIRQISLFSIQELYDMEPPKKYEAIISAIEI